MCQSLNSHLLTWNPYFMGNIYPYYKVDEFIPTIGKDWELIDLIAPCRARK